MSASLSRTGGCGCGGGPAPSTAHDCGCGGKGPRELPGACECSGPERCGIPCLERPVYSAGQLLTADALRLGQRYVEERFALRRYVDGVGVVCGLHVRCDPERPGWVVVEPGYAVDCCGRDVVLCEPVRMDLCAAIARCPRPVDPCGPDEPRFPDAPGDGKERTGAELGGLEEIRPRPRDRTRTYVLRAEPVWEGRDPVPVITRAGACDSGTECRPSREGATVRLCVVPLEGPPGYGRVEERTTEFRQRGRYLMDRLRQALEAAGGKLPRTDGGPATEVQTGTGPERTKEMQRAAVQRGETAPGRPGDAGRVRAVVDALLRALRDDPAPSACGLYGLLCALRARLGQDAPRAAAGPCNLPPEVEANPEGFLAAVVGHLVDGLREDYLALDCADCCEHTGVRLAHVVVDEALAGCGDGCFIAGIDTHSPSRESLHPRGDWWRADRVSLYDAYFRGGAEAGVLLSGRGLRVRERDAYESESPADLPPVVEEWLRMARPAELRRLGLYRSSDLYAPYGAQVVLWTVEGRVVSIEVEDYAIPPRVPYDVGRYVRLPLNPGAMEPRPAPGPVTDRPASAAKLDPAPFRETIDGVGDRIEPQLFRAGIRTYDALANISYEAYRRVLPTRTPVARELFESIQAQAREIASGARTWPEDVLRSWARDARRTLEQVMVQEGGS